MAQQLARRAMTEANPKGPRYYDPLTRRRLSRSQTSLYLAASATELVHVSWGMRDEGAVTITGQPRSWRRQTFNRLKHLFVLKARVQPNKGGPITSSIFTLRNDLRAKTTEGHHERTRLQTARSHGAESVPQNHRPGC